MRKLILILGLCIPVLAVFAQENTDDKPTIYFRLGGGYGYNFEKIPVPLDKNGQKHFRNLRGGLNLNGTLGFNIKEDLSIAISYTRMAARAANRIGASQYESVNAVSFAGIVLEKLTSLNENGTIKFAGRAGPGLLFARNQTAITIPGNPARSITSFNGNNFGIITGAGFNFNFSSSVAFELNVDKTWGRVNSETKSYTADVLAAGAGFRFRF